jgi:Bifunctional DNA primase/polymerase, N-terminal
MSRPSITLRDAALGYASRGIPVLPLHYPLPHRGDLQTLTDGRQLPSPAVGTGCSCRDPGCRQPGKHPLGSLVPHGLKDATTNRARVLAWWTQYPHANIGLATGRKLSTLVRQVDQGFVVPNVSSSGLLIHAAVGSAGGVGGLRTNRSGWAV